MSFGVDIYILSVTGTVQVFVPNCSRVYGPGVISVTHHSRTTQQCDIFFLFSIF